MNIEIVKVGCLLKSYANFMTNHEEDISHVLTRVSDAEYEKILHYHFASDPMKTSQKTIYQYLSYVIFRKFNNEYKFTFCKNLSSFIKENHISQIVPENKIDPTLAPLSAKKRDILDKNFYEILLQYDLQKPCIKIKITADHDFCDKMYRHKNPGRRVWAKWFLKNGKHIHGKDSFLDEFIQAINACDTWTPNGFVSFLFNQTSLTPPLRKILAELEWRQGKFEFCMFLALKRQMINDLDLPSIVLFYEDAYDIYNSSVQIEDVHFMGYKEIHAHTISDTNDFDGKLNLLDLNSIYSYGTPVLVSRVILTDEYEDAINAFFSKKLRDPPPKKIFSDFFRKAAEKNGKYDTFVEKLLVF